MFFTATETVAVPPEGITVEPVGVVTDPIVQPGWSETVIMCVPGSTASTCASWNARMLGWYSEYLMLLAPSVSVQVAFMPSRRVPSGAWNRVSSSTMVRSLTLKLSVLLNPGTKQCLLPGAEQLIAATGVSHVLYTPPLLGVSLNGNSWTVIPPSSPSTPVAWAHPGVESATDRNTPLASTVTTRQSRASEDSRVFPDGSVTWK